MLEINTYIYNFCNTTFNIVYAKLQLKHCKINITINKTNIKGSLFIQSLNNLRNVPMYNKLGPSSITDTDRSKGIQQKMSRVVVFPTKSDLKSLSLTF